MRRPDDAGRLALRGALDGNYPLEGVDPLHDPPLDRACAGRLIEDIDLAGGEDLRHLSPAGRSLAAHPPETVIDEAGLGPSRVGRRVVGRVRIKRKIACADLPPRGQLPRATNDELPAGIALAGPDLLEGPPVAVEKLD